ncbi:peroxisomal membrane protein 11C-like [Ceratina calcarata]|uniref:Peroxisomal membrane protein 11C-like n=1 Tax=Ceratina calcarata TaxID=156304 RepID=A0AAJ7NG78_9HYME|nr:peroxisomal membrane protein 11C-like [Ceratina calcarata]
MSVALISEYLDTYQGRDKFLRTLSYIAKFATVGTSSNETEKKLRVISRQMSECRVILRLLDDIPVLHYALTYGWGKTETDWLIRWTELTQIAVDIIFCPIEHISWAGEHKLIKVDTEVWSNTSTWLWIISLQLSLMKSLRRLKTLSNYRRHLIETNYNARTALKAVNKQRWNESLGCIRCLLDTSYAISYLPAGTLWGGKLKTWHVGALGTLSSLIGMYQALSKRAEQKKQS